VGGALPAQPSPSTGPTDTLFFVLGPKNPLRVLAHRMMTDKAFHFDTIVLVLIILSSFLLAIEDPLADEKLALFQAVYNLNVIFCVLFILEMLIKVVAMGFIAHRGAYLRSVWNRLDFFVVAISILSLSSSPAFSSLRSLRTLRALRPLRVIQRNPGLKIVVNALLGAVPQIVNVALVTMLFFMIFAIIAVNNFKGTFMACEFGDSDIDAMPTLDGMITAPKPWAALTAVEQGWFVTAAAGAAASAASVVHVAANATAAATPPYATYTDWCCQIVDGGKVIRAGANGPLNPDPAVVDTAPTSKEVCNWLFPGQGRWKPTVMQSFDNVFLGILALFELSTTEMWCDVMYAGVDATAIDMQPIRDNNVAWVVFFVVFMVVCAMFVLQLFVGVILDNFDSQKEQLQGTFSFTPAQREWHRMQGAMVRIGPQRKLWPPDAHRLCGNTGHTEAAENDAELARWKRARASEAAETAGAAAAATAAAKSGDAKAASEAVVEAVERARSSAVRRDRTSKAAAAYSLSVGARARRDWLAVRTGCFRVCTSTPFETFIMVCIVANTFTMASKTFHETDTQRRVWSVVNYFFALTFTVEAAVKLLGLGVVQYFRDPWNRFDFLIVLGTILNVCLLLFTSMDIGSLATVFRAFRVGRALRLVKRAETLRKLAKTLLATLPGLVNIGALLFMLFYVYAVMGMQLFAKVQYGEFIGEQANMQTFWNAMLLLFRASTGENWNGIMYVRESR
jgi:hypothetical protein